VSLQLLAILAAAAVLGIFAMSRVVRVRMGREARFNGWRIWVVALAVLVLVPIVLAAVSGPPTVKGATPFVESTIVYFVALAFFALLMAVAAALVRRFVLGTARPLLLLALVGREPSVADVPTDPPMTDAIRTSVANVEVRNNVFPRGPAFMGQTELPGFSTAWASLDEATRELESLIVDGARLGTGVASHAVDTASDARSRLDTLDRAAKARGQMRASTTPVGA